MLSEIRTRGPSNKETADIHLRPRGHRDLLFYFAKTTIKPLAPNDVYISLTTQLTSRRFILKIYSINTLTEYFKRAAHSPFFSLQDAVYFIMLSFLVPVIFTF